MGADFVNRTTELATLQKWFERPGPQLGVVWGRRRVGKTYLLAHWAKAKRAIVHTARNRPPGEELAALSAAAAPVLDLPLRDLRTRPFVDWDDAFDCFATAAVSEPLVVVLDEVPELLPANPGFESGLRAIWERMGDRRLRLVLCGSAVRTMEALQAERAPLFGRATLRMQVRPFGPHEAALMLPRLTPDERARAWGICGGSPFYLSLWDDGATAAENLTELFGSEQALLLNEGSFLLATEDFAGGRRERLPEQVLRALAAGRSRYGELKQSLGADPARPLAALQELGLIDRVLPVAGKVDPRLAYYRVADNFLAFWLSVVEPHRSMISQRLGSSLAPLLLHQLDHFMGQRWEEAFRAHLVRVLADDPRVQPMTGIGRFWRQRVPPGEDPCELDAVGLTGVERRVSLVGEAKWARQVDGGRLVRQLQRKVVEAGLVTAAHPEPVYAVCSRTGVAGELPPRTVVATAADIF
ncbi:ATP-binding protein [Natronosporangium hydrolyticum]|nr:ATP-binding protein [Natronosporangium hydrolyticum]